MIGDLVDVVGPWMCEWAGHPVCIFGPVELSRWEWPWEILVKEVRL